MKPAQSSRPQNARIFESLLSHGFIRQSQLIPHIIPFSPATLWRKVRSGEFPPPVKLSERITAWDVNVVRQWLADKARQAKKFNKSVLPSPAHYYEEQGLKLTGGGEWKDALCPFHDDHNPSLRVHLDTGSFKCMACGVRGGDILAFHMQRYGLGFIAAAKQLGAWRVT